MEIVNVERSPSNIGVKEKFRILFEVVTVRPFQFPFSNESLTERKIEFIKEED